jgi:hypothetical protein
LARLTRRPYVVGGLGVLMALGGALYLTGADDGDDDETAGAAADVTTTTLATGDLRVSHPPGWQAVPLPSLGFGLAVPPGWEATRTDPETLAALAGGTLDNPGFVDSARNAAGSGAVLYAAAQDERGRVSDVKVQVLPRPRPTSSTELRELADGLVAALAPSTPEPVVEVSGDTATFTVDVGSAGVSYRVTQVLRAGPDRVVSLIITSEDAAAHDDLAASIGETLTLSGS